MDNEEEIKRCLRHCTRGIRGDRPDLLRRAVAALKGRFKPNGIAAGVEGWLTTLEARFFQPLSPHRRRGFRRAAEAILNLHNLRGRLHLGRPRASAPTGRMLTSEQAIREVQAFVNEMQVAGAVCCSNEAISPEQEAALIARALARSGRRAGAGLPEPKCCRPAPSVLYSRVVVH